MRFTPEIDAKEPVGGEPRIAFGLAMNNSLKRHVHIGCVDRERKENVHAMNDVFKQEGIEKERRTQYRLKGFPKKVSLMRFHRKNSLIEILSRWWREKRAPKAKDDRTHRSAREGGRPDRIALKLGSEAEKEERRITKKSFGREAATLQNNLLTAVHKESKHP